MNDLTPTTEPQCQPLPVDAELVEWLRLQAAKWKAIDIEAGLNRSLVADHFTRAADIIAAAQRLAAEEQQRGADAELEACCAWLANVYHFSVTADRLRAARRPPAPSLRERALAALRGGQAFPTGNGDTLIAFLPEEVQLALQALEGGDGC